MFETNSRDFDIRQVMKEGPQPPMHSRSDALLSLSPGSGAWLSPFSHSAAWKPPRRSRQLPLPFLPRLLLQAFGRALGSVSTPSAPSSFFLLSPALTASQVTSAGPGAFPASSP